MSLIEYPLEDVERALLELVLCNGNARLTARRLKAKGYGYSRSTIMEWRASNPELYARLAHEVAPKVEAVVAQEAIDNAHLQSVVERELAERTRAEIDKIPPGQLASATAHMTKAKTENIKTAQMLRGKPTMIVERKDPQETLRSLIEAGVLEVVEGTAIEIAPSRPLPLPPPADSAHS